MTDRGRPIARLTPVQSDRRAQRAASGTLRVATENGIPAIATPIRGWSTEQMIQDMRGDRS